MELERIQNTGLALGAAPQTQSATSSSPRTPLFRMWCIRRKLHRNARVANEHSNKNTTNQQDSTSKIAR